MMKPAFFLLSSSLRRSAILSWKGLPAYFTGWTRTFSTGLAGRSLPQTKSTKFCWIPTKDDPFFSRVSASFRAPAMYCFGLSVRVIRRILREFALTGRDQGWVDTNSLATLGLFRCPFLPAGNALNAALEKLPVAVQLLRSLVEITAIGGQGSFAQGNDRSTRRSREARDKFCN
jgi:hypothetical protein